MIIALASIETKWYMCTYSNVVLSDTSVSELKEQTGKDYHLWLGNRCNTGHEYIRRLSLTFTLLCSINRFDKLNRQQHFRWSDFVKKQTDTVFKCHLDKYHSLVFFFFYWIMTSEVQKKKLVHELTAPICVFIIDNLHFPSIPNGFEMISE